MPVLHLDRLAAEPDDGRVAEEVDPTAFLARGAALEGAALGEGAFSPGPALWVGRREVAHWDAPGVLDLRLTKAVIKARRPELGAADWVVLKRSGSDWIEVAIPTAADADRAFALVEAAVEANRPTAPEGPPPTGSDLERRRRFH